MKYKNYIAFAILVIVLAVAGTIATGVNAQTPLDDPCVIREDVDNSFRSEIFDISGTVVVRETNLLSGTVTAESTATTQQTAIYNAGCVQILKEQLQATSVASLQGNEGQQASNWVGNRAPELQSCQDDMVTGQTFDFTSLGAGGQNQTISRMQECIELNSRVNRITIQNLLDILIAEGILE
jgi:hypothetical protein